MLRKLLKFGGSILCTIQTALLVTGCSDSGIDAVHTDSRTTRFTLKRDAKFVLLPIEEDAPEALFEVRAGERVLQTLRIRLAQFDVDYYMPYEVDLYPADNYVVSGCHSKALCWQKMRVASDYAAPDEQYRPLYHHTPPYGWMNDPNGMFYKDGLWHLYYQMNPYGSTWGNMHWGHSVSEDLVTWRHLPVALVPDRLGTVFSGSCVVDTDGVAGFGKGAVIAFYTSAGSRQVQSMAYSTDDGLTFTKYEGNPVVVSDELDFRDPKVFRHEPSSRWIMVLAVGQHMEFYSSADLRTWRYESSFGEEYGAHGGVWECPDMVCLPVDGDPDNRRWVLLCNINPGGPYGGSATQYFTGAFDGHVFRCDTPKEVTRWADFGKDHYAAVTWSGAPDGRCVLLAWMSNWQYAAAVPTFGFRSANSVPRELSLYSHGGLVWLACKPVAELGTLRGEAAAPRTFEVEELCNVEKLLPENDGCYEIVMNIEEARGEVIGFKLMNDRGEYVDFSYDVACRRFSIDRTHSGACDFHPDFSSVTAIGRRFHSHGTTEEELADAFDAQTCVPGVDGKNLGLRIFVDRASIECFAADGSFVMSDLVFPAEPYDRLSFYSKRGGFTVRDFVVYPMNKK